MKRIILLAALVGCWFKAVAACGEIPPFDPQFFDLDGDGADDVRHRQDTAVNNDVPNPTTEALRYISAISPARFLRSQGAQLNFSQGQLVSSANAVQTVSGVSEIILTDHFTIDFGGFIECHYMDRPNTWNALTTGIAGIRLQQEDGLHYGWMRFARPDLEPATPFTVVDYDWNPIPHEPIAAGEPPPLPPLQTSLVETGLTLIWDARFPNLQLEWAASLTEPADWQPVAGVAAGTVTLSTPDTSRFYRLRKP